MTNMLFLVRGEQKYLKSWDQIYSITEFVFVFKDIFYPNNILVFKVWVSPTELVSFLKSRIQ